MKHLHKLSKEELVVKCQRLESENSRLYHELDDLSDCYTEIENQYADTINAFDSGYIIKDIRHFKYRLQLDNLLTPQLESFIDDYLKYYNEI